MTRAMQAEVSATGIIEIILNQPPRCWELLRPTVTVLATTPLVDWGAYATLYTVADQWGARTAWMVDAETA